MNDKNNYALVRKPSSAAEKAAPRTKLILSDMVADTLALTKKPKGETQLEHTARMLRWQEQDKAALKAGKLRTSNSLPGIRSTRAEE